MSHLARFSAAVLVSLLVAGCGDDETGEVDPPEPTPGEQLCASIESSIEGCAGASPCDQALVTDCADVVDVLSEPFIEGTRACVDDDASSPTGCLIQGLAGLTPTAAHKNLASAFCSTCAFGAPGCEDVFFSNDGSKYALGTVILPLSDGVVTEVATECASGATCAATFVNCAQGVLTKRALPTETAKCLVESLVSGGSAGCGAPEGG
jgi:hypothetical protein